jgi:hypothetical protein
MSKIKGPSLVEILAVAIGVLTVVKLILEIKKLLRKE